MFAWLAKLFGARSAVDSRQENPVLVSVTNQSASIYEDLPLREFISPAASQLLARHFYLELNAICNAPNAVEVCREKLVQAVLRNALYQVLVIPPPPAADPSGLRDLAGVSGELAPHIDTLVVRNMALRADIHESDLYNDDADAGELVLAEYWKSVWLLRTLDATRRELGDSLKHNDWLHPFVHAACANQENLYRIDLDLPSAFEESIARDAPTAYSIYTDIVVSGAKDPMAEWLEYHKGMLVPLPGGVESEVVTKIQTA